MLVNFPTRAGERSTCKTPRLVRLVRLVRIIAPRLSASINNSIAADFGEALSSPFIAKATRGDRKFPVRSGPVRVMSPQRCGSHREILAALRAIAQKRFDHVFRGSVTFGRESDLCLQKRLADFRNPKSKSNNTQIIQLLYILHFALLH